jgi:hypothetical protein
MLSPPSERENMMSAAFAQLPAITGQARNVDDDAAAALAHAVVDFAREVDGAEELEIPGLAPALLVDLEQGAARNGARAIDQDIELTACRGERLHGGAVAEIAGMTLGFDAVLPPDLASDLVEIPLCARGQVHVAAFSCECLGDRHADALGGPGHQRPPPLQFQVHGRAPPLL